MLHLIQDAYRYRELIEVLTEREIKIRYKQSALGILWALFQPAVMVVLFTAIFTKIVRMPTGNTPYPLFVLAGIIPWNYFASGLTTAIPSLVFNHEIIKKIYFPRMIFPLVSVIAASYDFLITLIFLAIAIVYFKVALSPWILFVPVIAAIQFILMLGISLILSAANVFYRDVKNALSSLIQIWMFATPVIYPLEVIRPHLRQWLLLNPMTGIVDSYRKVLIEASPPNLQYLLLSAALSFIIFWFAHSLFKILEPTIADFI